MNRSVFYLGAVALHMAVLFWMTPSDGQTLLPKAEKKYVEVTLSAEPGPARPGPDSGPSNQAKAAAAPGPIVQESPPPVAAITPEPTPPPPTPETPPDILAPAPPSPLVPVEPAPVAVELTPLIEAPPVPVPPPPPVLQPVPVASSPQPVTTIQSQALSTPFASVSGAPVSGAGKGNAAQWSLGAGGNGHFYRAFCVPGGITWPEANKYATAHGGYLATIESAAENGFVFKLVDDPKYWLINTPYNNNLGPWLGGVRITNTANPAAGWVWANTRQAVTYTNWSPKQPDNSGNAEEHLQFYHNQPPGRAPTWNDISGSRPLLGFVVEYDTESAYLAGHPEIDPFAPRPPVSRPFRK